MEYKTIRVKDEAENIEITKEDLVDVVEDGNHAIKIKNVEYLEVRNSGNFKGKAIYLPENYDYSLGRDELGYKILAVIKKK